MELFGLNLLISPSSSQKK
uniref:Profilin n=1 Tax=Capsicum annuum TaxID=4072 RepID=Q6RJY6_CAPAN|nr:profilin [Capsicum annuum]